MARRPQHQLLVCGLVLLILMCSYNMASADDDSDDTEGSGDEIPMDEDGFCVKVLHATPTTITIYWIDPTDAAVLYYQVSYNVTVPYQTTAGLRLFTDNHTSDQLSNGLFSTFPIPLYSSNSTYTIRVTAMIEDGRIIPSRNYEISGDEFNSQTGQDDAMFFQLGLELTESESSLDCPSFENDYGRILLNTRSQLIEAAHNICTSNNDDGVTCAILLSGDRFSCYDSSRLIYVARVIGTTSTSAESFLEYLRMLGPAELSLHNQTFSIISSPSCPLSIPSAEESSCNQEAVTSTTTMTTTTTAAPTTTTTAPTTIVTTSTPSVITTASPSTDDDHDDDHDDDDSRTVTVSPSDDDDDSRTIVVIVTIACLVGIVMLAIGIICVIVICHHCNRYRDPSNSVDVEKDLFTVRPYSLIANTQSSSRRYLTEEEQQWNLPAQSFILPKLSHHKSPILTDQLCNEHADRQHTIEHHITTDH